MREKGETVVLIILTAVLVIASVWILCMKKTKESIYLFGICFSLMLEICGVMIFIAKKGGISDEVMHFFYISRGIRNKIQFFLITLNQMGFLVALGRTLFPLFLIEMAMCYSMLGFIRKSIWLPKAAAVLPLLTLVLYFPPIYRGMTESNLGVYRIVGKWTVIWITCYLIAAVALLLKEFTEITMKFCRRQFSMIVICLCSLLGIYCLYYRQDPGQIYHFYEYSIAGNSGIGYLQVKPSLLSYITLVATSVICCMLGFFSFFRYAQGNYESSREDIVMARKFDTAKVGVSMFAHGMKNQLLSSRVIYKRIGQLYEQPQVDTVQLKEYIDTLERINQTMLLRMEELYRSVKMNAIYMVPVRMGQIVDETLQRFHQKYPQVTVRVDVDPDTMVLSDKTHLCGALNNLLINAQEAIAAADRGDDGELSFLCHNERLYTVIEVRDNGIGLSKSKAKKIFEPFYSSKNSNFNWGMGLYYVREIVKSHLGSIRVESKEGEGSSFFILLPKY